MGGSATQLEDALTLMQCSLDCDRQAFLPFAAVMMEQPGSGKQGVLLNTRQWSPVGWLLPLNRNILS